MPYANVAEQRKAQRESKRRKRAEALPTLDLPGQLALSEPADVAEPEPTEACDWIEVKLRVPTGLLVSRPFRLGDWQRRFLTEALEPGIRESGLCVARKNGKSGLIAALLVAFLCGPLNRPNWRCVVTSLTGRLASLLREAVVETAEASGMIVDARAFPPPGLIRGKDGAVVEFLAADKATGHASSADLALIDEAGLLPEAKRPLWEAMISSTSARDGALMCISILGDSPMFRELRQRADDPAVCWHGYVSEPDVALDDETAWHAANPGLADGIKSLQYMRDMSRRALAAPASAAAFRTYDMNAPGNPEAQLLVPFHEFIACTRLQAEREGQCVVGVDLGGAVSMSCAAAYWPASGRMELYGAFGGTPDLEKRGKADGVGNLYSRMAERGELRTFGETRSTPVAAFLRDVLKNRLKGQKVATVVADKYKQAEALDAYDDAELTVRRAWRANTWQETTPDVTEFQRLIADKALAPGQSLLLESAIVETKLLVNADAMLKVGKARQKGRIDGVTAALLAVGYGAAMRRRPGKRRSVYRGAA